VPFEAAVADVVTFAASIPATRRIVAEANQLRQSLDSVLRNDLGLEVEDQIIGGNGTGENFLGISNEPNIGTARPPAESASRCSMCCAVASDRSGSTVARPRTRC
jgi:HK97 family phage major capsid protein